MSCIDAQVPLPASEAVLIMGSLRLPDHRPERASNPLALHGKAMTRPFGRWQRQSGDARPASLF